MNKPLTSRERLTAAINHKEADMIPLDLGSTRLSGISIIAYAKYLNSMGWDKLDPSPQISDNILQIARVHDEVLQKMTVDTRGLWPRSSSAYSVDYEEDEDKISFKDEWGIGWTMPKIGGNYFDMFSHPMSEIEGIPEVDLYRWPDPRDPHRVSNFPEELNTFKKMGDYGIVMHGISAGVLEMTLRMRGFEATFMDLYVNPAFACRIMDTIVDIKIAYWESALKLVGDRVLVVIEADDLGTQNSLLISPDMYRTLIKPRHKRLFAAIKKMAPHVKIFFHSCGSIRGLIPDLIEAGIDILNPIQVSASNMDTKELKRDFGDSLTFWGGGIDTQFVLPSGTPEQVSDEVKKRVDDLAPGGGYIFNTVHSIQADVPPENIMAMMKTFEEIRNY
jgi:uroporphyrinogen decarboxylase